VVNCAVESSNGRISLGRTDHLHQLRNAVRVDLVLLEVSQDTRNAVQRTLFVNKFDACRVPNQYLVSASTLVFGEDIDLRDRFSRGNGHVLYVPEMTVAVEQVGRVHETDSCQFLENFFLAVSICAVQLLATFVDVSQNVRRLHEQPRTTIDFLHVLVRVACRDIGFAAILLWICEQVIAKAALLRRQTEFIRTRSRLPALRCCGPTGFRDCVQLA